MSASEQPTSLTEIARPLFLRWERLRIPYNLALLGMTVAFHGPLVRAIFSHPLVGCILLIGAVFANL